DELVRTDWIGADDTCNLCIVNSLIAQINTQVYLEVEDNYGCVGIDSLLVSIEEELEVFVPNIFSPNSNSNKVFFVQTSDAIQQIDEILVYDRWGNLMFRNQDFPPNNVDQGWDGTKNGKLCAQGVYVYALTLRLPNGRAKTIGGDVTLIR
ncbi:MAG: gliding motility-associated C-terminal domain-containing protein, partial [Bacteroidota bacterium]